LQAKFNTNAFSWRLEGGYRFVAPWMVATRCAAAQLMILDLPVDSGQAMSVHIFFCTRLWRKTNFTRKWSPA
jgi:hypothetical protein